MKSDTKNKENEMEKFSELELLAVKNDPRIKLFRIINENCDIYSTL